MPANRRKSHKITRIMAWPDTHIPYHDEEATAVACRVLELVRPEVLVLGGDINDCYAISEHDKDPQREARLTAELDMTAAFYDSICDAGIQTVHVLEGNHEERLQRYIARRAPAIADLVRTIPEYLRIHDRGWTWTPYRRHMRIGRMHFAHDVGHAGKRALADSLASFGDNFVFFHTHRGGAAYTSTVGQRSRHVGLNCGWLGDFTSIDYMHAAKTRDWQHGFGWINMLPDGTSWASFVPIIKGACVVDGRVIRV